MELLVHFVVPFVALMLAGVELRRALPVSLFALLPDFDVFVFVHRSPSHSIIVMSLVAVPFLLLTYRFKLKVYSYALLAFASAASHLVLDVFAGYTPLLWPLSGYSVWIKTELAGYIGSSPSFLSSAQLLVEPTSFQAFQSLDAPLFTGEGLILSVVLLFPVLLRFFNAGWQQIREFTIR